MHPIHLIAATLTLALAGFAHAADTPTVAVPTVAERLASARQAIEARNWNAALRELQVAAREEPRNADIHNLLGYAYRKRANPDLSKAIEHYQTAIRLDPKHKGAHEYIGEAWLMQKNPAEAEKHLVQLERICGGKACEEYQDLAKAIADYKARN